MSDLLPGDVVQITADSHHWFPCLVTISEPKPWGAQGYVLIPHNDGTPPGQAYIRLSNGEFERIGAAIMLPPDMFADRARATPPAEPRKGEE